MNRLKNTLIITLILFPFTIFCQNNISKDSVLIAISSSDYNYLNKYIVSHDIDSLIEGNNLNPLHYAFYIKNYKSAKWLVNNGANINFVCNDMTVLMNAAKEIDISEIKFILSFKPQINQYNSKRNTALLFAARYANLEIVKYLVEHGADPDLKNFARKDAVSYAMDLHKTDVVNFLQMALVSYKEDFMSDFIDGPHIILREKSFIEEYFVYDSIYSVLKTKRQKIKQNEQKHLISTPIFNKKISINLLNNNSRPEFIYNQQDSIIVVGDIHGEYDIMVSLLQNNNVIDSLFNWKYNKGHLVFIGDIFDRGENVTESLWLIYHLEQQAEKAGGKVHFILGNHEMMILTGDRRYINPKYKIIEKKLKRSISDFYQQEYILGNWLRKKNTIEKIGDLLFVHAGISDSLIHKGYSIKEVNDIVYSYLNHTKPELTPYEVDNLKFVLTEFGPFWYRGYLKAGSYYNIITDEQLSEICSFYNTKQIIIGHTIVRTIEALFNGRIITTDISMKQSANRAHILIIENKNYLRGYLDGKRENIELEE